MRLASRCLATVLLVGGLLGLATPASAATIKVTTTVDGFIGDDKCGLREAIMAANVDEPVNGCRAGSPTSTDTIVLAEGKTYVLDLSGPDEDGNQYGDLDIDSDTQILGGRGTTIEQTLAQNRVVDIRPNRTVEIRKVTITGGQAANGQPISGSEGGAHGGGIRNQATLFLRSVRVVGNSAGNGIVGAGSSSVSGSGGNGGGIYNVSTLVIKGGEISDNVAGNGGPGSTDPDRFPGIGGSGGGLFNAGFGTSTVDGTKITSNTAGHGGDGGVGSVASNGTGGSGSDGGAGGGLAGGTISIARSVVTGNAAGNGGNGGNASASILPNGGSGGDGGMGGGIAAFSTIAIEQTTITGNLAGDGGDGGNGADVIVGSGGSGGAGGSGGRGGGFVMFGNARFANLHRSTLSGNVTGPGGLGGAGGAGDTSGSTGATGSDGHGGGIAHVFGTLTTTNSTISGNDALTSDGGGIHNAAALTINNLTITLNRAQDGGGLHSTSATLVDLSNTIIADNVAPVAPDCSGDLHSNGYNLIEVDGTCSGLQQPTDVTDADPLLGPLRKNGGPTRTHAIGKASPARDAGSPAATGGVGDGSCEKKDQRGKTRKDCDIGAYELVKRG